MLTGPITTARTGKSNVVSFDALHIHFTLAWL